MTRTLAALLLVLFLPLSAIGRPTGSLDSGSSSSIVVASSNTTDSVVATPSPVAGLSIPVLANTGYLIHCDLVVSSVTSTTGIYLSTTGPASPTAVTIKSQVFTSTTGPAATNLNAFSTGTGNNEHAPASSSGASNFRLTYRLDIVLRNGASAGNVVPNIDTEVDTSAVTAHAGSWCESRTF